MGRTAGRAVLQEGVGGDRVVGGRPPGETRIQATRRLQLIDAAVSVIAEHGLSGLTLAKVAGRAGLTAAMVNFHFRHKSELLLASLLALSKEYQERIESAVAAAPDQPRASLEAVIEANFDPALCEPRKVAVWSAFWGESQARAEYQAACGERDLAYDRLVKRLFREAAERAGVALDSEALAEGLMGLIEGQWQLLLVTPAGFDRAGACALCRRYLDAVLPRGEAPSAAKPLPAPRTAPLGSDGQRWSLPAWSYHNAAQFEAERERLHLPAWQLVCHESQIPRPGDAAGLDHLGRRVFAVRGEDGAVRAFHNLCRHRGHGLVPEGLSRCAGAIRCPYHGWTYGLDGPLKAVAARASFPAIDEDALGLLPVESEIFLGLVFVRLAGGEPSLASRLAPFAGQLAAYRIDQMRAFGPLWRSEVAADWKNVWDNFLEGYHFASGHPGLDALMERDYREDVRPTERVAHLWHGFREGPIQGWSARAYRNMVPRFEHLPAELARSWHYVFLFPGLAFDLYPDMIDVFQVLPVAPGRTRLRGLRLGLVDDRREVRVARWLNRRINMQVQREDEALIASVQAGLESGVYHRGPLSSREGVLAAFQDWIAEALPQVRQDRAPDARSG